MREVKPGGGGIEKNPPFPRDVLWEKFIPPPSSDGPITETAELRDRDFSGGGGRGSSSFMSNNVLEEDMVFTGELTVEEGGGGGANASGSGLNGAGQALLLEALCINCMVCE